MRVKNLLPHLLAWMVVFDLFTDAVSFDIKILLSLTFITLVPTQSAKVKNGYLDQLRGTGAVETGLLPIVFNLLRVGVAGKPLPLDAWAVDEFLVSCAFCFCASSCIRPLIFILVLDDESLESISILAAHVFYRALVTVPSLIRTWWSDCKDRQLSGSLASYTKAYFSPAIIKQQLAGVRSPQILSSLQNENFVVKVQPNVHEIVASYLVDEQQMEIALHIPSDYPLHAIEVKDVRRVGVQESKWRTWLLNVNQIAQVSLLFHHQSFSIIEHGFFFSLQTGLIVDALFWFKRNVSSFFEGKVECAICYSYVLSFTSGIKILPNASCGFIV